MSRRDRCPHGAWGRLDSSDRTKRLGQPAPGCSHYHTTDRAGGTVEGWHWVAGAGPGGVERVEIAGQAHGLNRPDAGTLQTVDSAEATVDDGGGGVPGAALGGVHANSLPDGLVVEVV